MSDSDAPESQSLINEQHSTSASGSRTTPFMDHNIYYPYQTTRQKYISPNPALSFDSKRIMRQAQDPMTPSRVSHFLYEVITC